MQLQKRFFDHFLRGDDNDWEREPPVQLNIRRAFSNDYELRKEQEWPLARTSWTKLFVGSSGLTWEEPGDGAVSFDALGEDLTLYAPPLAAETEITGPLAAKLFVTSSTTDADLFLTLRAFSPQDEEVDFLGALDPRTPLAQGWLRASHRQLDPERSRIGRPYHPHSEIEPLDPGAIYELDVEVWPTCIVLPSGYRLALTIGGKDFARPGGDSPLMRGSGLWLHNGPDDRPASVFGGTTTIHTGGQTPSHLLLPIVPRAD
jgi:predicted acyl esterase